MASFVTTFVPVTPPPPHTHTFPDAHLSGKWVLLSHKANTGMRRRSEEEWGVARSSRRRSRAENVRESFDISAGLVERLFWLHFWGLPCCCLPPLLLFSSSSLPPTHPSWRLANQGYQNLYSLEAKQELAVTESGLPKTLSLSLSLQPGGKWWGL